MVLEVDLASPNEKKRRQNIVAINKKTTLELAKKAQIQSLAKAKTKAQKRKEMTLKRAMKRKREDTGSDNEEEEHQSKKKKTDGRVIPFTDKDRTHCIRLFNTNVSYFGSTNILGLTSNYDVTPCPVLIYPIFTGPQKEKKQSVYSRDYILGVGKQSNVITGIKQAFSELYPQHPSDRVYDWQLYKWNKKAYKAPTVSTAVDPAVLSQKINSSKSFGGAANLQTPKIIDDLLSTRKMENAIEVSVYIRDNVSNDIKGNFPGYTTITFNDVLANLKAAEEGQKKSKETEQEVEKEVEASDIIQEAFERRNKQEEEEVSDSETEEGECSEDEE